MLTWDISLLQLIDELEGLLADQPEPKEVLQYKETMVSLQELVHTKYNLITEDLLKVLEKLNFFTLML